MNNKYHVTKILKHAVHINSLYSIDIEVKIVGKIRVYNTVEPGQAIVRATKRFYLLT